MNLADGDSIPESVIKSMGFVQDAVDWADKIAEEIADTGRIEEVLTYVTDRTDFLLEFTGHELPRCMEELRFNAWKIAQALEDVHYLADSVKGNAWEARALIQSHDNGKKMARLSGDEMEMWEKAIADLVRMLDDSANDCERIRGDLDESAKALAALNADVTGMIAVA